MTAEPNDDNRAVTGSLPAHVWDSEEAVAYEAAVEAINGAVGAYTAQIAVEQAAPVPSAERIDALREARARCAQAREDLDPADHGAVAETRRRFAELARQVREGRS